MDTAGKPHSQQNEAGSGLDRRSLIKRAAVAGAVAWTAPAVIGSLASPAGALTVTGCSRVGYVRGSGANCGEANFWVRQSPAQNGTGCLDPNDWNNQPDYTGTITVTTQSTGVSPLSCRTIITITDTACAIDTRSAVRDQQGNDCYTVSSSGSSISGPACRQITIVHPADVDDIKVLIACDGQTCPGGSPCPI